MSTIPDWLYDRLANACITYEDGAALIALLVRIDKSMQSSLWAAERIGADLDVQAHWRLGAWELVADQYRDLVGGAR